MCLTVVHTRVYRNDFGIITSVSSGEDNFGCKNLALAPPNTKIKRHRVSQKRDEAKVWFRGSKGDPPYTFKCKLDKRAFKSCDSPKSYKHLDRGKHKIKVKVIDSEGEQDEAPAKWKFRIKK